MTVVDRLATELDRSFRRRPVSAEIAGVVQSARAAPNPAARPVAQAHRKL